MKKVLLGVLFIIVIFCSVNVDAEMQKFGNFYLGSFDSNQANWTRGMDLQLLSAMANVPEKASLEIFGYTDNSGPMAFNEELADKRANLAVSQIKKLRPKIKIRAVTGMIYQAGANDINYKMVRVYVYVPDEWLVTHKELAEQLKAGLAAIMGEQMKQKQSIKKLQELGRETSKEVSGIKRELKAVSNNSQVAGVLSKFNICIALATLVLVIFAYYMIRRYQKKNATTFTESVNSTLVDVKKEIVEKLDSLVIDVKTISVDYESDVFIISVERRRDGFWHSPFKSSSGQPIYRAAWKDIKKSVAGSVRNSNEFFQKQREDLIAAGKIEVKEKE